MKFTAIAGLDPSLTSTGLAVTDFLANPFTPDQGPETRVHRIQSKGKVTDTWKMRAERQEKIAIGAASLIPVGALVIVEAPAYSAKGAGTFDRYGLWWNIYHKLVHRGCVVVPAAPTQRCRYATGKGNAGKDEVLAAAVKRYPDLDITGNDVADAVIFLAMGHRLTGTPIDVVPESHLTAMEKLQFDQ